MLEFGEETTRMLNAVYAGSDVSRRRRATFDALAPHPGERIADVGCGNGFLTSELASAVGRNGHIDGVDPSGAMLDAARERCKGAKNVRFHKASAERTGLASNSIDAAVSVQVFEYIDDVPAALREMHRILVPDGRLVIADIHFDSLVWQSGDPARMARMKQSWDGHLVHRDLPARLSVYLRDAGFEVERVTPHTTTDTALRPDGLAKMMLHLMSDFAISRNDLETEEVQAWVQEQHLRATQGTFFFSITQFVTVSRKSPASPDHNAN